MTQFLRAAESQLIAFMSVGEGDQLEELAVRSGLAPSQAKTALTSLERRGLVAEGREKRYYLTASGLTARSSSASTRESRRGYSPVFLLDDDIEETANSSSQEELDLALDHELGPRDQNSGE
jgi:DNA-binding IclR family transcriptional regulator